MLEFLKLYFEIQECQQSMTKELSSDWLEAKDDLGLLRTHRSFSLKKFSEALKNM